ISRIFAPYLRRTPESTRPPSPWHRQPKFSQPSTVPQRAMTSGRPQPSQHRGEEPCHALADPMISRLWVAPDVQNLDMRVRLRPLGDARGHSQPVAADGECKICWDVSSLDTGGDLVPTTGNRGAPFVSYSISPRSRQTDRLRKCANHIQLLLIAMVERQDRRGLESRPGHHRAEAHEG